MQGKLIYEKHNLSQWCIGGDISMNHGAIISCKWAWDESYEMPVLLDYQEPITYVKNDDTGKMINSKSEFPKEIEKFASRMRVWIMKLMWDAFTSEAELNGDLDSKGLIAIEWANATANYRGSRKLASVVHAEVFAMLWLKLDWKSGTYFINPSLTRLFRGKEKVTCIDDYVNLELVPFILENNFLIPGLMNKEGDIYDAMLVSLGGFLKHNSLLDEYVLAIKKERKEIMNDKKEG